MHTSLYRKDVAYVASFRFRENLKQVLRPTINYRSPVRRQDEIGIPYCVTVEIGTLEYGQVTVRDRDTMEQVRIPIEQGSAYIGEKVKF